MLLLRKSPAYTRSITVKPHKVTAAERIDLLVATVNEEIAREITKFEVRLVQLWFDAETAEAKRETDITSIVAV
jgi:hypothetical protein